MTQAPGKQTQNQDTSDLTLKKKSLLIEFETALRIWESWNGRHLRATYNFLVLWTTLGWPSKSQITVAFAPASSNSR